MAKKLKPSTLDVSVVNCGSIFMITPLTPVAKEWVDEHVGLEGYQWMGPSFACEHCYVDNLISGMQHDGLDVV